MFAARRAFEFHLFSKDHVWRRREVRHPVFLMSNFLPVAARCLMLVIKQQIFGTSSRRRRHAVTCGPCCHDDPVHQPHSSRYAANHWLSGRGVRFSRSAPMDGLVEDRAREGFFALKAAAHEARHWRETVRTVALNWCIACLSSRVREISAISRGDLLGPLRTTQIKNQTDEKSGR